MRGWWRTTLLMIGWMQIALSTPQEIWGQNGISGEVEFFSQYQPDSEHPFGRPHPSAPGGLAEYGFMIGEWACEEEQRGPEESWQSFSSRMTGHYILNGFGIMNHTHQAEQTSSMTYEYDAEAETWTIVNLTAPAYGHTEWTGRKEGDRMVAERLADGPQGQATVRLTFHDIQDDEFHWKAEVVTPVGPQIFRRKTCRRVGPDPEEPEQVSANVVTLSLSSEIPSRGRLGGVAVDSSGSIYVSNFSATVWRIEATGEVVRLTSTLQGSSGNAVDRDGTLLQASFVDGRIVRIHGDGTVEPFADGFEGPVGITVGNDAVYVCDCRAGSIARVDRSGSVTTFARDPRFECPNGIAIDETGALYVASFGNPVLVRVSPSGDTELFATLPGGGNAHIAYDGEAFYVTKIETNQIYRVARDGSVELYAGTGEVGVEDGPRLEATFARPNGIAVTPDREALIVNNLVGEWRGEEDTTIILRQVGPLR